MTRRLRIRGSIREEGVVNLTQFVVGSVAGTTFVTVCLIVFFCCCRVRKTPKEDKSSVIGAPAQWVNKNEQGSSLGSQLTVTGAPP
jgi:hypothetical protein